MHRSVHVPIITCIGLRLGAGVALFSVFLIEQPDLAFLVLHFLFVQVVVHPTSAPSVVLGNDRDRHQVFAVKHQIVVASLRLHLCDLLILDCNYFNKFLIGAF